jgi:hypothetical protein
MNWKIFGLIFALMLIPTVSAQSTAPTTGPDSDVQIVCDSDYYAPDIHGFIDIYCDIINSGGSTKNEKIGAVFDDWLDLEEVAIIEVETREEGETEYISIKNNLDKSKPLGSKGEKRTKQLSQQNIQTQAGTTTQVHFRIQVPFGSSGKFDIEYGAYVLDPWWNATWVWRQPVDINVSDGTTQTDIQVYMNVTWPGSGNMTDDFSDLRVLNNCSDDAYEIPFCLGSDCIINDNFDYATVVNQSYAEIYARIPTVNSTICLYGGNANATSASNAEATFHFIDDFESGLNTTKWPSCSASISSGKLQVTGSGSWNHCESSLLNFPQMMYESLYKPSTSHSQSINLHNSSNNLAGAHYFDPGPDALNLWYVWNDTVGPRPLLPWAQVSAWYSMTGYYADENPGEYNSFGIWNGSKHYGNYGMGFGLLNVSITQYSGTSETEWFRIRKYYEPAITTYPYAGENVADTDPPIILIFSPTNTSYPTLPITVNVSTHEDADWCGFNLDGNDNETLTNSSMTDWLGQTNSSLTDGTTYHLNVYCNDTSGNMGYEDVYFTYDVLDANFVANTPANTSLVTQDYVEINVSSDVYNYDTCTLVWNGVNETVNGTGTYCEFNKTSLTEQVYIFEVYVDYSGTYALSEERTVTVVFTGPDITIIEPTGSYRIAVGDTTYNVPLTHTITDDLLDSCWYDVGSGNVTLSTCENTTISLGEGSYTLSLYANNTAGFETVETSDFTVIDVPINGLPGPFAPVAAVAVAAGFILLMVGIYLESGMNVNFFITGTVGLIIVIALIGYLLTGS